MHGGDCSRTRAGGQSAERRVGDRLDVLAAQMVKELIAWFPQSQQTAVSVQ